MRLKKNQIFSTRTVVVQDWHDTQRSHAATRKKKRVYEIKKSCSRLIGVRHLRISCGPVMPVAISPERIPCWKDSNFPLSAVL